MFGTPSNKLRANYKHANFVSICSCFPSPSVSLFHRWLPDCFSQLSLVFLFFPLSTRWSFRCWLFQVCVGLPPSSLQRSAWIIYSSSQAQNLLFLIPSLRLTMPHIAPDVICDHSSVYSSCWGQAFLSPNTAAIVPLISAMMKVQELSTDSSCS